MAIEHEAIWKELLPRHHLVKAKREAVKGQPRDRVEFRALPRELYDRAMAFRTPCVYCRQPCQPFRDREGVPLRGSREWGVYYTNSCRPRDNPACSHSDISSREMQRTVDALKRGQLPPGPKEPLLF